MNKVTLRISERPYEHSDTDKHDDYLKMMINTNNKSKWNSNQSRFIRPMFLPNPTLDSDLKGYGFNSRGGYIKKKKKKSFKKKRK
jgi:hypothetical protein